ncbi:hypothetical protein FRC08_000699 [Ceratobasidium sp. 394]|nr:hypothetical protein FRC08_000699 [Ceratobasidium sp. 394]
MSRHVSEPQPNHRTLPLPRSNPSARRAGGRVPAWAWAPLLAWASLGRGPRPRLTREFSARCVNVGDGEKRKARKKLLFIHTLALRTAFALARAPA